MLVSPVRNHKSSRTTVFQEIRLVVMSGMVPSERSKRSVSPKVARVPTPVRSRRGEPSLQIRSMSARYWRSGWGGWGRPSMEQL